MREIACAVFLRDGKILLGFRSPHRRSYPSCWDVVGGHVEPGETPDGALVRELQEEVGVTPTLFRKFAEIGEPRPEHYGPARLHVFVVTGWEGGEPRLQGDEHTELRWFAIDAACALPDLAAAEYPALFRMLA